MSRPRRLGETFTISVRETGDPPGMRLRHAIGVRRQGTALVVDLPTLAVACGDTVVWYGKDASIAGFAVKGIYGGRIFDSSRLKADSMFTHAFGAPGEFRWADAYGSGVSGVVTVRSAEAAGETTVAASTRARLTGVLIRVCGDTASPSHVELVTGQTAFWAVDDAPGISITDARLLEDTGPRQAQRSKRHRLGRRAS